MAEAQTQTQVAAESSPPVHAPVRTNSSRAARPLIVGANTPEEPFPIWMSGAVARGFGRGGKDLGCPTANLPDDSIVPLSTAAKTGVYYGYAQITVTREESKEKFSDEDLKVHPMVMSLGYNPYYGNKQLSAEIHIMHNFPSDFYGQDMKVVVLGYIRPELDYISKEALIEDIETDKKVALNCLERLAYKTFAQDGQFRL